MKVNLPWYGAKSYWICIAESASGADEVRSKFPKGEDFDGEYYGVKTKRDWRAEWKKVSELLEAEAQVAVLSADDELDAEHISPYLNAAEKIDEFSENYWLADALANDQVICHFQKIVNKDDEVVGYESFARAKIGKEIISGGKIIQAAYALNIQHMLDKYLQDLAITTFAKHKLEGCLHVNFITGFIQKPEKYLESLSEAVKANDLSPKRIVLDVVQSGDADDVSQIASVIEYCNGKGYLTSLDNLKDLESMESLLKETNPDIVKIDREVVANIAKAGTKKKIEDMVSYAHIRGCKVLAEGIEDRETAKTLEDLGADMFQGYYFSKPVAPQKLK